MRLGVALPESGVARPGVSGRRLAAVLAAWLAGLLITVLIVWTPWPAAGFRSPGLHRVLDTADACVALLVAYLAHGRFTRSRLWQDRLLAEGLVLLAVASLSLGQMIDRLPGLRTGTLDVWLPLGVRVAGSVCIASAALAGARPIINRYARRRAWLMPGFVLVLLAVALWLVRARLPLAFPSVPAGARPPLLSAHPALLLGHGLSALCFFIASVLFTLRPSRPDDPLQPWLGPAFAVAGFARVDYLLFPSLYTDWIYTGDLLRTGSYVLLLLGAVRELNQYWTAQARAAVLEDRRRLARELHDGVIQELAFIRYRGLALPDLGAIREDIVSACDRGLDEARAAVQALGRPTDEALGFALHRAAREMAERYQVDLEVDLDDSIVTGPDQRHALLRISREAVSNAVRHGGAGRIQLRLHTAEGRHRLVIQDDGHGFDIDRATAAATGYGLVSMRERATALPGTFDIHSEVGCGSVVTVTW